MSQPETAHGYFSLLRSRPDFRNLWLGQLVSFIGDWFNFIALYTAVQSISSSGKAIAVVMVVKMVPMFLVSPIAGPIVDRFDRRLLLITSDIARAVLALGLVLAYHFDSLVGLYACTVLMMCCTGVAFPAKNAVLPMILPRSEVPVANALGGGTWSVMLAIGAATGGIATEYLGITAAFLIDGATFVAGALFYSRLPKLPPPAGDGDERSATFVDGVRYLLHNRYVMALVSLKSMMQLAGGLLALIPFYGTIVFDEADGPVFVGLLFAVRGVGAAIGALVVRVVFGDTPRSMRRLVLVGYVFLAMSYLGLSQAGMYWHAVLAFFGAAIGQSIIWVFSGTLLQLEGDPVYHGRVFAVEFGLSTLTLGTSSMVVGALVDVGWSFETICIVFASTLAIPLLVWSAVLLSKRS